MATSEAISKNAPEELRFVEEVCEYYGTKAFTNFVVDAQAVDGFLISSKKLFQVKTTKFNNWVKNINSAYNSAKNANINDIQLYLELLAMTKANATQQWLRQCSQKDFSPKADGIISKCIARCTDGWVELDVALLQNP